MWGVVQLSCLCLGLRIWCPFDLGILLPSGRRPSINPTNPTLQSACNPIQSDPIERTGREYYSKLASFFLSFDADGEYVLVSTVGCVEYTGAYTELWCLLTSNRLFLKPSRALFVLGTPTAFERKLTKVGCPLVCYRFSAESDKLEPYK